jgi:hypothetical protein
VKGKRKVKFEDGGREEGRNGEEVRERGGRGERVFMNDCGVMKGCSKNNNKSIFLSFFLFFLFFFFYYVSLEVCVSCCGESDLC